MKKILILAILPLLSFGVEAKESISSSYKKLTFGAEWSYISSFHYKIHHNFFSEEGYRVDLNQRGFDYESNGEVLLHCGYNFNHIWNLSLYSGFVGIYDIGNTIPFSLRLTRYFNEDRLGDRWLCFLDAGSGVCLKKNPQMTACLKLGGGYRISLSRTTKMDFIMAYRASLTHPEIVFDGKGIPYDKINRNNAYVSALSFGISLSF